MAKEIMCDPCNGFGYITRTKTNEKGKSIETTETCKACKGKKKIAGPPTI